MIKEQEKIIRLLDALFPGVKIYLFGSRAQGTNRPNSDIDLAIDVGRELDISELGEARMILEVVRIPQKIDLIDLQSAPEYLKNIILKEGILWKS